MSIPRILFLLILSCLFHITDALPRHSQLFHPSPPAKNFTRIPPSDPTVIYRTASSTTTLAIRFFSYGAPNNPLYVQHLLEHTTVLSWLQEVHVRVPAHSIIQFPGEGRLVLTLHATGGMVWGQWRIVLDAMREFFGSWESRDYLYQVWLFEEGRVPRGIGSGVLWTGTAR